MASKGSDTRPGPDKKYYESDAGVVYSSAFLSNDCGFGDPPAPAMRGGPDSPGSATLDGRDPRVGNNGVPGKFFRKGK